MFKAQFGNAKYSELAFAIPTRIDASGTYGVVEYKEEKKEMIKDFLGYGRSRSSTESNVLSRHFNPYVNCIHTQTGHCRENMEVLIAEFDMSEIKHIGQMSSSQNSRVIDPEGISYAVTNGHKDGEPKIATSYRIRKLTPRECFRLMGVTETDIDKIQQSGVSQSQQYKMAGNSIVVDCLYHMFRKMFTETACESQQLSLF